MKQLGLVCQVRAKRKYSSYKGEVGEVAPNLLERHFKTNQPNRKWVTDVTEFKVNDQKLYLSPILDLFNGEVVSYNLSRRPNSTAAPPTVSRRPSFSMWRQIWCGCVRHSRNE